MGLATGLVTGHGTLHYECFAHKFYSGNDKWDLRGGDDIDSGRKSGDVSAGGALVAKILRVCAARRA